jgi:hypothetical protein
VLAYASALHGLDATSFEQAVLGGHLAKRGHASLADALHAEGVALDKIAFETGLGELTSRSSRSTTS